ncbi:MAG: aconitase family protein, partial [Robiginitomaculum sp.]|nr:aconitase family protein [Robiginitomaculum sp.]
MNGLTLFEKLWRAHKVCSLDGGEDLLYIDRIFLHERTGGVALVSMAEAGHKIRRPEHVFATMDHIVDTRPGRSDETQMPGGKDFITITRRAAQAAGITLFDLGDERQGIVHVISPEQGIVLPGLTIICPDSHTCTQGAFGALAFGIGSTQAEHAMATATLRLSKPKSMLVNFDGALKSGVTAKDMILYLISTYGTAGGRGYAIEFGGAAVRALSMEARMTLCNMAIEAGGTCGICMPDQVTAEYLWPFIKDDYASIEDAVADFKKWHSDVDAEYAATISFDVSDLTPQTTFGFKPDEVKDITELAGEKVDQVYIGSCTNGRIEDLREAAAVLAGKKISSTVRGVLSPATPAIYSRAMEEGLIKIFMDAGFCVTNPTCGACLGMSNGVLAK